MNAAPRSHPRLDVGQALREGWQAFNRAPWLFVGFTLLLAALQLLLQSLQPSVSPERLPAMDPGAILNDWIVQLPRLRYATVTLGLTVLNALLGVLLNLWGTCGLVRASWVALGGVAPGCASFLRWDPRALLRLYLPGLLLGCGVTAVVVMLVLLAVVLGQVNALLILLPALLLLTGATYLSVSQAFLPQLALLHDDHPFEALAGGPRVVDPAWWRVMSLLSLNVALVFVGLLACGVGLLVAVPLATCVATAAYRQLFGADDRTGLTRAWSETSR